MQDAREDGKGRDNFSEAVKERLAAEVGYRCSLPDCGAPTIGPSSTEPKGFSNSGVAAHITAASKGGPRFDEKLSPDERRSHANGIHCCAKHGRIIDNDRDAYTTPQLLAWKAEAIDLARRAHSTGDIDPNGRIKLARATRNEIAVHAVKASIRCRAAIMTGISIADSLARTSNIAIANTRVQRWTQEMNEALSEADAATLDIRVCWGLKGGEPAGLSLLVEAQACLVEWHRAFFEGMQEVARRSGLVIVYPPCAQAPREERWDWAAVFRGVAEDREKLQDFIDRCSRCIEAWAEPFIVSRDFTHGPPAA